MKRLFVTASVVIIFTAIVFVANSQKSEESKQVIQTVSVAPSSSSQLAVSNPQLLTIEKLKINTAVEYVGTDSQGRMDVPKNYMNVSWYMHGAKPGEKGNAVLAGHFDTASGTPAVFFDLKTLKNGDMINVIDEYGNAYKFTVLSVQTYELENIPLQEIFGQTDSRNLNLITCDGVYDAATQNYSQRVVVYSKII